MSEQLLIAFEEWRPVVGFEGRYNVSNYGRVKSLIVYKHGAKYCRNETLKGEIDKDGYVKVRLYSKPNDSRNYFVHRLVLIAFVGTDPDRPQVNHKNGNKSCNVLSNLEWTTNTGNIFHARTVLKVSDPCARNALKPHCPNGHPYDRSWKKNHRYCSICYRAAKKRLILKRREEKQF